MAENTETNLPHDRKSASASASASTAEEMTTGREGGAADTTGALYRAFDSYPWQKDQVFALLQTYKAQLLEALHSFAPPDGPSLSEIALLARVRRFEEQTRVQVDAGLYTQWLAQTNGQPPRIVAEQTVVQEAMVVPDPAERRLAHLLVELGDELGALSLQYRHESPAVGGAEREPEVGREEEEDAASVPTWQAAAPRADLYIQKNASPGDPDKEPYPRKFEEIIEFLKTGKEIPGIRKIPDTVVEDPAVTPQGRLRAPPKPWEVGRVPSTDNAPTLGADKGGV